MAVGRPRTCDCGECPKCRHREKAKARWRALSIDEKRAVIARRDPEKVAATEAARFQRHKEQRMALSKSWAEQNRSKSHEIKYAWAQKNADKRAAHAAVQSAVRSGRLFRQPCEVCGTSTRVQAHHDDYSKHLDVRWLCPTHHGEHHRMLRQSARQRKTILVGAGLEGL